MNNMKAFCNGGVALLHREAGRRAGHAPEKLKVGLHSLVYVAETSQQASDEFFPNYARSSTKIGRERGWPPITRARFEAGRGPNGALLVRSPQEVAEKIARFSEELGGISRVTLQMHVGQLPHAQFMRGIELLGHAVALALRG